MKFNIVIFVFISCLFVACKTETQVNPTEKLVVKPIEKSNLKFQNKGHELVYAMVQKVGDYSKLAQQKNVSYTYTYQTPDGKKDVSTEKYIFDGELSYGIYKQHERTFPQLEGIIEQGYNGSEYWLKHKGELLTDDALLKRVAFNRPTNFYWFTMMQKLLDSGLNYQYLGEKNINNQAYNIVKVSFNSTNNKPTDIYQLYINKATLLVDQFLFTVADFNVIETPFLMQLEYEEVAGILVPTKRMYKKSSWDAKISNEPWIKVNWSNIKFNSDITKANFDK